MLLCIEPSTAVWSIRGVAELQQAFSMGPPSVLWSKSLQGIFLIVFWKHLQCVMLLCAHYRHVAIKDRGRIVLGEVRNLIASAKKHRWKKTEGAQSAEIQCQDWWYLEGIIRSGLSDHLYWPLRAMDMPWSFLFSSHPFLASSRWFTFWIYVCVIYKHLLSWPQQ